MFLCHRRGMKLVLQSFAREPPCSPPFCEGEAEVASLRQGPPFFVSLLSFVFFANGFVVLIIVITRGRPVRAHAFSPSLIPVHPSCAWSPPPSAIDFGQANYIFSPVVERIKL